MAELKDLGGIVLVLVFVGMLIGVGIIALDKFGVASRELTTISNESFTMPVQNGVVSLANGNLTVLTQILNSTGGVLPSANYSVDLTTGAINNTDNVAGFTNGSTLYAYYKYYEYDTKTATSTNASRSAIADISTTWMSLLITILILALLLGLILSSFGNYR